MTNASKDIASTCCFFCIIIINNDNNKNSPALDFINIMLRAFHIFFSFLLCYSSSEIFVAAFVCFIKRFYIVCSSFSIFLLYICSYLSRIYIYVLCFFIYFAQSKDQSVNKDMHMNACVCACVRSMTSYNAIFFKHEDMLSAMLLRYAKLWNINMSKRKCDRIDNFHVHI